MPSTPFARQWSIVIGMLLAAFSSGAGMGYPSVLLYQLKRDSSEIPLDLDTSSWIGSIQGLAGIPAIIAPFVMQWRGRKFTFIAGCLAIITGWAIVYSANGIAMILASESFHGFGANVLTAVAYDCLSEMITPAYRNIAVQSYGIFTILGLAMPGIFAKILHWRTMGIMLSLPAIFAMIISIFWLESPLWLAYKNNMNKFKTNFIKLRGNDELSIKELHELMAVQHEKLSTNKSLLKNTFLKKFRRQITSRDFFIPALHVFLLLNNSYWSGSMVVLIYSIELISKATQNEDAAFIGGIVINLVLVAGSTICNILIRLFNNKPVLMFSSYATTASLLGVSIVTYLQSVGVLHERSMYFLYLLVSYIISSSLGQSPIAYSMASELIPVKHRGIGGALCVIYACFLNATSLKISPYLFVSIGLWGTFLVYTLNSIVCGFLIWKYVPETKGKTLQEIENFYTNGTFEINLCMDEIHVFDIQENNKILNKLDVNCAHN